MRVLCYSPYNRWALHGQWEMTILHGLRRRGAEVHYVLCDGLYSDCDVFWASTAPRPPRACVQCQGEVIALVHSLGMEFEWLGRYLLPDEQDTARAWADALAPEELLDATYGDWPVGEWVRGSVHSHLRRTTLDLAEPEVERVYRSYLYSGLVACFALDRLLAYSRPDVLFIFNGRMSSPRVAFELALRRGIRVVTHERGLRRETLHLTVDEICTSQRPLRKAWEDWRDVPLTAPELDAVSRLMHEREHGTGVTFRAFTPPPQPIDEVRAALGLQEGRPTWVLFTSSDDEVIADAQWRPIFPSQLDWVRRSVEYAGAHPELDLVVRIHPNTGSRRSIGANTEQLEELRALARDLPPNVRLVDAEDEISTYTLMEIGDVGLVYHSTAGLEMACKGKRIVVAGRAVIRGTSFVRTIEDPARYEETLATLHDIAPGTVSAEIRRLAYRFAYTYFFRYPVEFPLVRMRTTAVGDLAWRTPEDLDPGRDAGLDRCTGVILDGDPVVRPPSEEERARSTADEDAFLAAQRRVAVLAFADELIEERGLLEAWGGTFSATDPATLLIRTPPETTERLVEAVGRAGLDRDGTAELVAVDGEVEELCEQVEAVYTRRDLGGALAGRPRFDDSSTESLRRLVCGG